MHVQLVHHKDHYISIFKIYLKGSFELPLPGLQPLELIVTSDQAESTPRGVVR